MWQATPTPELDLEALEAQVLRLLGKAPVAEATGAKLSRILCAFLEGEVLPQAERAAELGLDPTSMLAVVADVLRLDAAALEHPGPTADPAAASNHLKRMMSSCPRPARVRPWTRHMA